jgi:hypothetical protein
VIARLIADDGDAAALIEVLEILDALAARVVLVGGHAPPLILAALNPDGHSEVPPPRRTYDLDLAIDLAADASMPFAAIRARIEAHGWRNDGAANQFRWVRGALAIDLMPVPAGVERDEPTAVAFARTFVWRETGRFFRGYELALAAPLELEVQLGTHTRRMRVCGLVALLAMKLRTWRDSPHRGKDVRDIVWVLTHLDPSRVADALLAVPAEWAHVAAEVVDELTRHFADEWSEGARAVVAGQTMTEEREERERRRIAATVRGVLDEYWERRATSR